VPQDLDQPAAPAAEQKQMAAMRDMLQSLLHQQRQAIETLAQVSVAGRKPHPNAARDRDHRRRLARVSALISADTIALSTGPLIRIRPPVANSTSIALPLTGPVDPMVPVPAQWPPEKRPA
jgi:hypothetical protein